jgi:teichuronic acid biosynthesis glycosyltransferase TuaH
VRSHREKVRTWGSQGWDNLVVIASGMSWDDLWLVEKQLALQLAKYGPVLFVDPPMSYLTRLRKPELAQPLLSARLRQVQPNLARLTPLAPPGLSRPLLRNLTQYATRVAIKRATRRLGGRVKAIIVCSLNPLLRSCPADRRVLYGTDDWVAGASLMGLSPAWLAKREDQQLREAELVVAVSPTLAEKWAPRTAALTVIGNGCDADAFGRCDSVPPAEDVHLPEPIAGFFGHLSDRIDADALMAVAETGASLLLVGPRQLTFDIDRFNTLLAMPNVQWIGSRNFLQLPSYMRKVKVGLTPYVNSAFNTSSFPLKTLEYLAAGRACVVSDLPWTASFPPALLSVCGDRASFAAATVQALAAEPDTDLIEKRKAYAQLHSWTARGRDWAELLGIADPVV